MGRLVCRHIGEENDPLQLVLVLERRLEDLELRQGRVVQGHGLLLIQLRLEIGDLDRGLAELGEPLNIQHHILLVRAQAESAALLQDCTPSLLAIAVRLGILILGQWIYGELHHLVLPLLLAMSRP